MRALLIILCIVIVIVASLWGMGIVRQQRVSTEPWPAGLGTLRDIPQRFPKAPATPAANELMRLAGDLAAARRHLLTAAPIQFEIDLARKEEPPSPPLTALMQLFRLLAADALERGAWEDLEASWKLARVLFARPDQKSQIVALAGLRLTSDAARSMPLPAPEWVAEMLAFDPRPAYLRSMQAEAWVVWRRYEELGMIRPEAARVIEERRRMTEQLAAQTGCGVAFTLRDMPNLSEVWARLFRMRAELELTERALAARAGAPPQLQSRCSDGHWVYETRPDGSEAIRFSRPLPGLLVVTRAPAKPRST
jgi:hypothetical protein